jgi:hypothetical protein
MDVAGESLLYDESMIRVNPVCMANSRSHFHSLCKLTHLWGEPGAVAGDNIMADKKSPSDGQSVESGGFTRSLAGEKSLEGFKKWIKVLTANLNPNAKETMTEEDRVESWQKFWSKEPSENR